MLHPYLSRNLKTSANLKIFRHTSQLEDLIRLYRPREQKISIEKNIFNNPNDQEISAEIFSSNQPDQTFINFQEINKLKIEIFKLTNEINQLKNFQENKFNQLKNFQEDIFKQNLSDIQNILDKNYNNYLTKLKIIAYLALSGIIIYNIIIFIQ